MAAALEGLRVVEVTHGMAGEMAGMVLADYGADVVKIEPPGGVSSRRHSGFAVWNRGKRSAVADLTTTAGRRVLDGLLGRADVLIEDLRPSTVERLGLGYDGLAAANPGLVYVAITGFGERGPLKDLPGYEYLVSARSGRMADQATIGGERPAFTPTPINSFGAAMLAVQGALAALHQRARGGGGQRVHTSLLHTLVTLDMTSGHGHRIHQADHSGRVYGVMPLAFMTARCKDGRYLQMCSRFPHLFRNWMRVLGLEHLYDDPAYAQMPDVFPSQKALDDVVAEVRDRMAERTLEDWLALFSAEDVGANPFLSPQEFLHCEQAEVTHKVVEVDDPERGRLLEIGPLAELSATPAAVTRPAPTLGDALAGGSVPAWADHVPATAGSPVGKPFARYPLEDITVVECGFAYAAPQAMTLLAEMGARVIKVEPPEGDPARRNWLTTYFKEGPGKESVIADLKSEEGRAIVRKLVEGADIFLHNFRPGVPRKLGVDYDTLRAINPRLIYVYGSCYGSVGPWSHLPGFHSSPNAISGTGWLEAGQGNPPQNRTFGDPAGALALAAATLVALRARESTGEGQYVEGTMLASLAYAVSHYSVQGPGIEPPPLLSADQRGLGPWVRLYETAEGWLALCCLRQAERDALGAVLAAEGCELGLAAGQPSGWVRADEPGGEEVARRLAEVFTTKSAASWEERLAAAGVPAVRADDVKLFDFMLRSPHMRANDLSIEDDIEGSGRIWRSSGSVEFGGASLRIASPVPLGADTARVLAEIGYSAEEIASLEERGITRVVGQGLT